MSKFVELLQTKQDSAVELEAGASRMILCPDMGGRAFAIFNSASDIERFLRTHISD